MATNSGSISSGWKFHILQKREVFRESEKERAAKWRDANREVINERARIRRREIKKEAEKKKEGSVNVEIEQSMNQLVVKTENLLVGRY